MDIILEFIFELLVDASIEISSNKKINKIIRYPLMLFVILLFLSVIFIMLFLGFNLLKENIILGLLFIILGIVFLIGTVCKLKKLYLEK